MSKETFYSAVDIGSNKVFSVVARIGAEGELKVLGTGMVPSQGVQKGRIENVDEARVAVSDSLEEAERYIGRDVVSGVYTGVSGSHLTSANTKTQMDNAGDLNNMDSGRLEKLAQASAPHVDPNQEILHIVPISYEVDGLTSARHPSGLQANQVEVECHVVTGEVEALRNAVKSVQSKRTNVRSLVLSSMASAEAVLTGDEKEMGVVMVDIGGGASDMVIYRQGNPWYSAVIPVGGNQLTRDLAVAMRIPYYLAEEIKTKWGSAMTELVKVDEEVVVPGFQGQPRRIVKRRALCEPLQERTVEIFKLILLRMRQAGMRQIPPGGLVLTGGCVELQGLRALARDTTGGPVRLAYPSGIAGLPTQLQKPNASAVVGLLLWGIKHHGQKRTYSLSERSKNGRRSHNDRKSDGGDSGRRSLRELLRGRKKEEQNVPVA